jgi:hypothetical protein
MGKQKITIRLSPSEKALFSSSKFLEEKLSIANDNEFAFALSSSESPSIMTAEFKNAALLVHIPAQKLDKWVNSGQVGLKEIIKTDSGREIQLTLEEDLPPRKFKKKD